MIIKYTSNFTKEPVIRQVDHCEFANNSLFVMDANNSKKNTLNTGLFFYTDDGMIGAVCDKKTALEIMDQLCVGPSYFAEIPSSVPTVLVPYDALEDITLDEVEELLRR